MSHSLKRLTHAHDEAAKQSAQHHAETRRDRPESDRVFSRAQAAAPLRSKAGGAAASRQAGSLPACSRTLREKTHPAVGPQRSDVRQSTVRRKQEQEQLRK
eukprot:6966901-Prymnesium_polylepis.1